MNKLPILHDTQIRIFGMRVLIEQATIHQKRYVSRAIQNLNNAIHNVLNKLRGESNG